MYADSLPSTERALWTGTSLRSIMLKSEIKRGIGEVSSRAGCEAAAPIAEQVPGEQRGFARDGGPRAGRVRLADGEGVSGAIVWNVCPV